MTPYEERDAEIVSMIRREIDELRARAKACNWAPSTQAWQRAFGELSGMHRILMLLDPDANDIRPNDLSPPISNGES